MENEIGHNITAGNINAFKTGTGIINIKSVKCTQCVNLYYVDAVKYDNGSDFDKLCPNCQAK